MQLFVVSTYLPIAWYRYLEFLFFICPSFYFRRIRQSILAGEREAREKEEEQSQGDQQPGVERGFVLQPALC